MFIRAESLVQIKNRFLREIWSINVVFNKKYKASKTTIDLRIAFQQKSGLNLSMFYLKTKPATYF